MSKRRFVVTTLVLFALVTIVTLSSTSVAAQGPTSCTVFLQPIQSGAKYSDASKPTCFANLADAVSFGTGGRVHLPPSAKPSDINDALKNQALQPNIDTVIGIMYDGSYESGNSFVLSTTHTGGCADYSSFGVPDMSIWGWSNRVYSARTYDSCTHFQFWDYTNYNGATIDCGTYCGTMGAMGGQAESFRLFRS